MEFERRCRAVVLVSGLVMMVALGGCALARHEQPLNAACSGVPGDFRTPEAPAASVLPTHGPGGTGAVMRLRAISPRHYSDMPPLYIFDEHAGHVMARTALPAIRADPIFARADEEAYWFEVVGDEGFDVPEFDKCTQAQMLVEPFSFYAPPGGLLFVQYLTGRCTDCAALTRAIKRVINANPQLPVRWAKVAVSRQGRKR